MTKVEVATLSKDTDRITILQEHIESIKKSEEQKADNIGYSEVASRTGADGPHMNNVEGLTAAYDLLNKAYHELNNVVEANS